MKLICGYDLDSNPIAIISWANSKGETVMSSEKFAMNNGSEEVSLKIANVNKDDNGTWTCTVKVPRNKALHCSSEEERSYLEHCHLQLIVVSKLRAGIINRLYNYVIHDCLHIRSSQ